MDPLTLEQVAVETGGTLLRGDPTAFATGVSTDSRTIEAGRLFVPLIGERFDGHAFIADALARGAAGTLLQSDREIPGDVPSGSGVIAVDDTLRALQQLAAGQRKRLTARVVAVTGSNGKTTTKDMIAAVVGTRRRVVSTKGNFNNEIGLPLTLLDTDVSTEVLVVEMGMRGLGEIRALVEMAQPHVGVVTNVSPVHLERLGSVENIARAKQELIDQLPSEGTAVLNGDDELVRAMAAHAPGEVLFFGLGENNHVRATDVVGGGEKGSRFVLHYRGRATPMLVPVPGRHNVMNALAAAAASFVLGLDEADVIHGLAAVAERRSAMRMEVTTTPDGVRLINDAYNASPASMAAALELLSEMVGHRHIAVLGDMLELGPIAEEAHVKLGQDAARLGIDKLVAVGRYAATVVAAAVGAGMHAHRAVACRDAIQAATVVGELVRPGDVVLVKASRGIRLEQVAEHLSQGAVESNQGRRDSGP